MYDRYILTQVIYNKQCNVITLSLYQQGFTLVMTTGKMLYFKVPFFVCLFVSELALNALR